MVLSLDHWAIYFTTSLTGWLVFVGVSEFLRKTSIETFPSDIPTSGLRAEWCAIFRASCRQFTDSVATLLDGYRKYSRRGGWFLLCETSFEQELMVPPEHVKWFCEQPPAVMSSKSIREERHASRYLHMGVEFESTEFFLERIMRDSLTKNLDMIQEPMYDETQRAVDAEFGAGTAGWKTVKLFPSLQQVMLQAMCRVFFSKELCRDRDFMVTYSRYILSMSIGTMVIGQLPRFLKAMVVPSFNLPLRYYRAKTLKILLPVVEQRLAVPGSDPYDFISQCAKVSKRVSPTKTAAEPSQLAEWMMLLGFAAFNSLAVQASHVLLDILHCPRKLDLYGSMREECSALLASPDDWHRAETFNKMTIMDSAIRESLRVHPMLIKGLTKEVMQPGGLDLPGGAHLAQGAWVGVPVLGIHRDERFYPEATTYDPYRFIKLREARAKDDRGDNPTAGASPAAGNEYDAGKPSTTYLGFGYGRHACPGRWYAVLMIKTMLAYIVLNYDMVPIGKQPPLTTIGDAALPPMSVKIGVRRRKLENRQKT